MRIKDFDAFEKRCRILTDEYYEQYKYLSESKELSEKAKEIKEIISQGDFGCREKVVTVLCSKYLNENININSDNHTGIPRPPCGVLLKTKSNPNSHDYMGQVVLKSFSTRGLFCNGYHGNNLPASQGEGDDSLIYYKPSEKEIDEFFKNLRETNIKGSIDVDLPVINIMSSEYIEFTIED